MQMPDKWEDPYVFVEDYYAHFAGKRRMAMCSSLQMSKAVGGGRLGGITG